MNHISVESMMSTKVLAVTLVMTIKDAIFLLVTNKISGAPVIDGNSRVISVVSEGDLLKLAAAHGLEKKISFCLDRLVKPEKLITAKKSDSFSEVYKLFLSHPVHRIIIVDSNGKLQGIVSRSNVLKCLAEAASRAA